MHSPREPNKRTSEGLFLAGKQRVESRFAAIGGVAMNDSSLGGLVERRDQPTNLFRIRFGAAAHRFLQCAQSRPDTAILNRAGERLTGTFCCGFCVSHLFESGDDGRADRQNVKMSILNQVRGPDATFICEASLSFLNPFAEAGASKP